MTKIDWLMVQAFFQLGGVVIGGLGVKFANPFSRWPVVTMWTMWFIGILCMMIVFVTPALE